MPNAEGGVKIELRDLRFKYPMHDTPIFNGLSLNIGNVHFASPVGTPKCGKTSIISLLERYAIPYVKTCGVAAQTLTVGSS